ncbi:MAG: RluA family pseudouridine synthase [Deltaproteobacteria bacterium]|nr:RluA family pseudouridine synthase [Deltaproteobacteria bacterium]
MTTDSIESAFTSRKWHWTFYGLPAAPSRLVDFLISKLPHIDPSSWPDRFSIGGVFVNGLAADEDLSLPVPCKVEYYEPKVPLSDLHSAFASPDECKVVYEDDYLAVVWKPARLSCLPAKEQKTLNLKCYMQKIFGADLHMPSRLDMSTQGLVLFSRNQLCHSPLQKLFEKRAVNKRYLARVTNSPNWRFKYHSDLITRDLRHPVLRRSSSDEGLPAATIFRKLPDCGRSHSLLMARPLTGRTHQIRVHCAHLGLPILGDKFYGGTDFDNLCLLSYRVTFRHPVLGSSVDVRAPDGLIPTWVDIDQLRLFDKEGIV